MATCAICLEPIITGEKFVISETEVMHRTCVAGGMTLLATVRQTHADQRVLLERALRAELAMKRERDDLLRQLTVSEAAKVALAATTLAMKRECDEARQALDRSIAERDEARLRAAGPIAVVDEPHTDDAVVRFSLLEIDTV